MLQVEETAHSSGNDVEFMSRPSGDDEAVSARSETPAGGPSFPVDRTGGAGISVSDFSESMDMRPTTRSQSNGSAAGDAAAAAQMLLLAGGNGGGAVHPALSALSMSGASLGDASSQGMGQAGLGLGPSSNSPGSGSNSGNSGSGLGSARMQGNGQMFDPSSSNHSMYSDSTNTSGLAMTKGVPAASKR